MNNCLNGGTHGPVHIAVGGEWDNPEEEFISITGKRGGAQPFSDATPRTIWGHAVCGSKKLIDVFSVGKKEALFLVCRSDFFVSLPLLANAHANLAYVNPHSVFLPCGRVR